MKPSTFDYCFKAFDNGCRVRISCNCIHERFFSVNDNVEQLFLKQVILVIVLLHQIHWFIESFDIEWLAAFPFFRETKFNLTLLIFIDFQGLIDFNET